MLRPFPFLTFVAGLAVGPLLLEPLLAHEHGSATAADGPEAAFLAANATAMATMMQEMEQPPSGDVDHDFVAMMVPHHQGAIDMAQTLLRYGGNETLKRLAQEIIVTQQQEIAAMRLALGEPLPPSAPAPTVQPPPHPGNGMGSPHQSHPH